MNFEKSDQELQLENAALKQKLEEYKQMLVAVRNGEVDALVVSGKDGNQIYTLRGEDTNYRLLVETMNEGTVSANSSGTIIYCNTRFSEMLGIPIEKITGSNIVNFINKSNQGSFKRIFRNSIKSKSSGQFQFLVHSKIIPVYISFGSLLIDEERIVCMVFTDLTELKKAQNDLVKANKELENKVLERTRELSESESRFRSVLDNSFDVIYRVNLKTGRYEYISPACTSVVGFTPEELMDLSSSETLDMVHPEDRLEMRKSMARALEKGVAKTEYRQRAKNGEYRWISNHIKVIRDASGTMLYEDGCIRDITERRKMELEMQEAKEAAEKTNRIKSEFISNVSHELRTPLNAILGYTQLMTGAENLDSKQKEYMGTILKSGTHLLMMINDILDLSKLEAGKMQLQIKLFSLQEVLNEIYKIIKVQCGEKNIVFDFEQKTEIPPTITGDRTRLQQVLLNLLSNAVKFTEKGKVTLRVGIAANKQNKNVLKFEVEDTGIGIPQNKQEMIFNSFQQVDYLNSKVKGTGLGLTISRSLVRLMGSEIYLESRPGHGSRFWFELEFKSGNEKMVQVDLSVQFESELKLEEIKRIPPPEDLKMLYHLVSIGDIMSIRTLMENYSSMYPEFAKIITDYSKDIEMNKIKKFLEGFIQK